MTTDPTDTDMDVDALADRLTTAVADTTGIPALTDDVDLTLDDAYRIQDAVVDRLPGGDPQAAKLGLTSRAKQQQMNVDEPLYGWFGTQAALHPGQPLDTSTLIQPRVEPEIALLTATELSGPATTAAHVLTATRAVMPAIDVLDSRFTGYDFTLPDVVADNCSAARYATGDPTSPDGLDLRTVGCTFHHNGRLVDTAAGAAVLDHPAGAVAWLVRKLAERDRSLPAGTTVLAGALTAAIEVEPGDTIDVTIDRIGRLTLRCE